MVVLGLATSHHDSKIAGTFAQQLGWVFVGPFHPSAHGPLRNLEVLHLFRWFTRTRTHTHIYIYLSLHIYSLSLSHAHTHTHKYIYIYIYIYIYVYIYMYIHTHISYVYIYYIGRPLPGLLHDSFVLVKWDFSLNPMQGWKSQSLSQPRCWI